MFLAGFAIGLAAFVVVAVALRSTFHVAAGHCAVLVTFGRARTRDGARDLVVHGPGRHLKLPWQRAISVSMKEERVALDSVVVRYAPARSRLYDHLFGLARPSLHVRELLLGLDRDDVPELLDRYGVIGDNDGMGTEGGGAWEP